MRIDNKYFIQWCYQQHDDTCNQKYGNQGLPFSYHLKAVIANVERFSSVLTSHELFIARRVAAGHDLIEDARITYNEIKGSAGEEVAEGIFLCTEFRGRDRKERKPDQFYEEMKVNKVATYVKLCDIAANTFHSIMERNTKFKKAKEEWPNIKKHLYRDDFKALFDYIEQLYTLPV